MKVLCFTIFLFIFTLNISSQDFLVSSCDNLSGSWKIFKKKEFYYDSLNNQEVILTFGWNDIKNEFFPKIKEVEYLVSKECKLNYSFNWSFEKQEFEKSSNGLEYYDSLGNLVLEFFDQLDEASIFGPRNLIKTQLYNNNNKIIETVLKKKKINDSDYLNYEQIIFIYNSGGKLIIQHRNSWDVKNNMWINLNRKCLDYFIDGSEKSSLYQEWDKVNQIWVNATLIENYEDTLELDYSFELEKKWQENDWVIDSKVLYNYDKNGNCIEINNYEWDKNKNYWNLSFKTNRIYNIFNNMVKSYSCKWNEEIKQFENTIMLEYNYDLLGKTISQIEYFWKKI